MAESYVIIPLAICCRLLAQAALLDASRAMERLGTKIATMRTMIRITTSNSTRVKPPFRTSPAEGEWRTNFAAAGALTKGKVMIFWLPPNQLLTIMSTPIFFTVNPFTSAKHLTPA